MEVKAAGGSGVACCWACRSACRSARCRARRRAGEASTYITSDKGATPYNNRVKQAPMSEPWGEVASARAIIKATYIQAMATIHMVSETGWGRGLTQIIVCWPCRAAVLAWPWRASQSAQHETCWRAMYAARSPASAAPLGAC